MIEELFGVRLLKEHSAVGLVHPAAAAGMADLRRPGRRAADRAAGPAGRPARRVGQARVGPAGVRRPGRRRRQIAAEPRHDPWRRTSGIHKVRTRRGLGLVAELWYARDEIAREQDRAPGKILPDLAISDLAAQPDARPGPRCGRSRPSPVGRPGATRPTGWRPSQTRCRSFRTASCRPCTCPTTDRRRPGCGPAKDPVAAARLAAVREALDRDRRRARHSRWRTCSPPTTSAGWPGDRRSRSPRKRSTRRWPVTAPGPGSAQLTVAALTPLLG